MPRPPASPPSGRARRRPRVLVAALPAVLLWPLGPSPAAAQAPATIVPITAEPSHHLALTNAFVRVFDVTAAPHATTLIHRHDHDYVFVTLGDADITSSRTDAAPARLVLKDGAIEYAAGGFAHSVTDNLDRPFHNITIELLHSSTGVTTCTQDCDRSPPCATGAACTTITRAITADQWNADEVTLASGATWALDRAHAPALVVVVSNANLQLNGEYESTTTRHRAPGNLIWLPDRRGRRTLPGGVVMERATPAITNAGPGQARIVVLEWKRE